jgi:hypothetical protein
MTADACRVADVDQGMLADGLLTVGRSDGSGERFVVPVSSIVATKYQQPRDIVHGEVRSRTSQVLTLFLASGQTVAIVADGTENIGVGHGSGPLLWALWERLWVELRERAAARLPALSS